MLSTCFLLYRADNKAELIKRAAHDFAAECQTRCNSLQQQKDQLTEDLALSTDSRKAQSLQLQTVTDAKDALTARNEVLCVSLDRYVFIRQVYSKLMYSNAAYAVS